MSSVAFTDKADVGSTALDEASPTVWVHNRILFPKSSQWPTWANWFAVDNDGSGKFFEYHPIFRDRLWETVETGLRCQESRLKFQKMLGDISLIKLSALKRLESAKGVSDA